MKNCKLSPINHPEICNFENPVIIARKINVNIIMTYLYICFNLSVYSISHVSNSKFRKVLIFIKKKLKYFANSSRKHALSWSHGGRGVANVIWICINIILLIFLCVIDHAVDHANLKTINCGNKTYMRRKYLKNISSIYMHPSARLKRVTYTYKQDVTFFLGAMELKKIDKGFFCKHYHTLILSAKCIWVKKEVWIKD